MKKVVSLCAVALVFGALSGCITSKQSYVSKGNKLYDAGKYSDASLNYRKAMQKDPNYGEAYYRLGLAAIKLNDAREAYNVLFRAVQLLPDRVDVAEKFADVCLTFYMADPNHPQALYKQITQLSKDLLAKNPNSYEALMLQGYLASTDRKPKEAIAFFRAALKINNSDAGVKTALVQSLMQDGQVSEAEKLGTDLIYREKTNYSQAYDLMYAQYFNTNRLAEAENVLKAKVSNDPKRADWIIQLARHYNRIKKPAEMQATLQRLLDNPKDFPQGRLWVGDYYMGLADFPSAVRYYEEGVSAGKEKTVYQDRVLVALLKQGKSEEGLKLTGEILKESPEDETALSLRGDLLLDGGKSENLDTAIRIFQGLTKRKPVDPVYRLHLGRAYVRKGDLESARKEVQEAVRLRKTFAEAKYELGLISLLRGHAAEALQQANDILASQPDDRQGKLLRTESLIHTGDLRTATLELGRMAKETPQDSQVQLQLALIAMRDRKFPEALDTLNRLRSTGDVRVYVGLATIYTSRRDFEKAFEVLNEGLKKSGNNLLIHNQMAITALLSKQYDRAIDEFQQVLAIDPTSVETMRRLADLNLVKGSQGEALRLYRKAYDTAPNDVASGLALANGLAQTGKTAEARAQYLSVVKTHPEDPVALNNAAYFLADTGGDLDEALRLAQKALEKSPQAAAYSDTVGYVYLKKGLNDSAVRTFGALVRKNPHVPAFRYHLGLALYFKGDKSAARRELQAALADQPTREDEQRIKDLIKKLT